MAEPVGAKYCPQQRRKELGIFKQIRQVHSTRRKPCKDLRELVLWGLSAIYHTSLVLIPIFTFTSKFPRGTITKTSPKSYRKVKLHLPYTKFQLSCLKMVPDYPGAISQGENTIRYFHLLFALVTSIILFFKIYSEALQDIKISITTFIDIFFSWIRSMKL